MTIIDVSIMNNYPSYQVIYEIMLIKLKPFICIQQMPFKKKSVTSANKKSPTAKKSPVVKKTSSKSETTSKPSKKGGLTAIMFLIKGRKVFADITGDVKFPHTSV